MIYAKVVNGEIVEHNKVLPFSDKASYYGLDATPEFMLANGYLPVIGSQPEFDTATHKLQGVSYEVTATQVNKVYSVVEKTAEDLLAEAKALVPTSVTPRQARIALLRAGMLDAVNQAVTSNAEWAITWEFATEVKRDDPMIAAVQELLGKTELEIDQLFIEASKL